MYHIIGRYKGRTEVVDTAPTRQAADVLCREYQMAFGAAWTVSVRWAPDDDDREDTISDDDPLPRS